MASEVDICNLALGYLGDEATVSSINPPEGSAQAQHCARFYPIARNAMMEKYNWNFSIKRASLAQVTNPSSTWLYAYAAPNLEVNMIAVIPSDASDDNETSFSSPKSDHVPGAPTLYTPQRFVVETDSAGKSIILTNTPNAVLRYSVIVTDTTQYSPLFVVALSWLLASMLAGPLIKGDAGAAESKRCLALYQAFESQAESSDAGHGKIDITPVTPWIAGR